MADLMTDPSPDAESGTTFSRASASYECQDDRYLLPERTFLPDIQYAPIYFARMIKMQPMLLQKVQKAWPGIKKAKILELVEGEEVAVIGTVYKEMKMKPSILDEYTKDRGDHFLVNAVLDAGLGPQRPLPAPGAEGDAKYLAFVSGLGVGDESANPQRLALVVDYLTGMLGDSREHEKLSRVVRCIVAGGLLRSTEALAQPTTHTHPRKQADVMAPIREMDVLLSQLAAAMPVDVMPGASDPANHSLPQQRLHHCLFPGACSFTSFHRVTNPHSFKVDGVHVLGTAGQNVDDVFKYSTVEERLQILERILHWGHLIPTAPDTLAAHPFPSDDPFIVDRAPHVLFAGCQPEFASRCIKGPDGQQLLTSLPSDHSLRQ
ncbi:hypothetical protein WJX73_008449 [Symbiochloris irregularis]|uniref:DNA polymerase delta subunit 2 n=1 Tax=Symbiochloris irregularis TaxID=706552 RepID=A0AAW1PZ00_9CHLO